MIELSCQRLVVPLVPLVKAMGHDRPQHSLVVYLLHLLSDAKVGNVLDGDILEDRLDAGRFA